MKERLDDSIYVLIGKYLDGSASSGEKSRVESWINNSSENRKEYERVKKVWHHTVFANAGKTESFNTDAAWEKMKVRISGEETNSSRSRILPANLLRTRNISGYLLRIAAVIVVVIGLYTAYNYFMRQPETIRLAAENEIVESVLPDESVVTLNEESVLMFPEKFRTDKRVVELQGEAFFEVSRNVDKPFVVRVPDALVEVLGTSFNVRAFESENEVSVTVQEGKVMLTDQDDIAYVMLEKNEKGVLNRETGHIEKYVSTDDSELFWKTRTLIFRETPLSNVFKTLEKLYKVRITIKNEAIKSCLLSAKFQDQEVQEILSNIAINFNLEVIEKENAFEISGEGC